MRNFSISEQLVINSSKSSNNLISIKDDFKQDEQNKRTVLNRTNCMLVGAFSIAYLDRKYDLFKNYLNNLKIEAKVADKERVLIIPNNQNKPSQKQSNKPNIRQSFNFIADAVEQSIPR